MHRALKASACLYNKNRRGELDSIVAEGSEGHSPKLLSRVHQIEAAEDSPVFAQTADQLFCSQAYAFVNAVLGICDPHLASGLDGVKALAVCDAARRASDSRREETVEYS